MAIFNGNVVGVADVEGAGKEVEALDMNVIGFMDGDAIGTDFSTCIKLGWMLAVGRNPV